MKLNKKIVFPIACLFLMSCDLVLSADNDPQKPPRKVALITGITGQDGAYLAEFLLEKGYEVHGIKRRASLLNTARIDHLYEDQHLRGYKNFVLHYGDVTDPSNIMHIVQKVRPDEIYNLAAQSHVQVSFELPEYTANVDGLGALHILEAIRTLGLSKKQNSIKHQPVSFMAWFKKFHKKKLHHFIRDHHIALQNYMHSGSPKTIVKHITCLR